MSGLVRISVSLEADLGDRLDGLVAESGCENRSELIRGMIRQRLAERAWERDEEAIGTVTLVYDHRRRRLGERLTEVQHAHHGQVLATTHVHLDAELCAEMIMVRGRASEIRAVADGLRLQKGVLHASLSIGSTGKALERGERHPPHHPHERGHAHPAPSARGRRRAR